MSPLSPLEAQTLAAADATAEHLIGSPLPSPKRTPVDYIRVHDLTARWWAIFYNWFDVKPELTDEQLERASKFEQNGCDPSYSAQLIDSEAQ